LRRHLQRPGGDHGGGLRCVPPMAERHLGAAAGARDAPGGARAPGSVGGLADADRGERTATARARRGDRRRAYRREDASRRALAALPRGGGVVARAGARLSWHFPGEPRALRSLAGVDTPLVGTPGVAHAEASTGVTPRRSRRPSRVPRR